MNLFWFKSRKIHVDFFTKFERMAALNPIQEAHHFVPDWWKKLDTSLPLVFPDGMSIKQPTMKTCAGFINLYRVGLIVPMWADLSIKVHGNNWRYYTAANGIGFENEPAITFHGSQQTGGHFNGALNLKINSPWRVREKSGVSFLYTPCTWSTLKKLPKINFFTGVLQFKHNTDTHIQTLMPSEESEYSIEIESGTPLMHLIPLSEKKIEPHIHVIDADEYEKLNTKSYTHKFIGTYLDVTRKLK